MRKWITLFLWFGALGLLWFWMDSSIKYAFNSLIFNDNNGEGNLYSIFLVGVIAYIWLCIRFTRKKRCKPQLWILALTLVTYIAYYNYNKHQVAYYRSLVQVYDSIDLYYYQPFNKQEDNNLATLETPSQLKFTDKVPRLDGATGLYPLYAAFVQAVYPQQNYDPNNQENSLVLCSKTPQAYENLINGKVDVIFVAGPSDAQIAAAKAKGVEFNLTPIGKEAFVFFVNHKNPVNNLTVEQIRQIYSGKITNWRDVGGSNDSIRAYQRSKNSGSQTALERIMGNIPLMQPITENRISGMNAIIDAVATYRNYPNGLGYSFLFFATQMVNNKEIKLLSIDGVEANHDNIRSGKYPFAKEFYAVTRGDETRETRKLIEWIRSEQGKELIRKSGFVPME